MRNQIVKPSRARAVGWVCFALAFATAFTLLGPQAWLPLIVDGAIVAGVLIAAAGLGAPLLRLPRSRSTLEKDILLATGLGLGALSVAASTLAVFGVLHATTAWALLIAGWVGAAISAQRDQQRIAAGVRLAGESAGAIPAGACGLSLGAFCGLLLWLACLPPGVIWADEARAYDALEYHLQAPREYYDAGRVLFLPHNVYAGFPQQVETLTLLMMHIKGGPYAGAIAAQLLHAGCAILTALAAAAWAGGPRARLTAMLLCGATPWLTYLGCLAYVECGVLFFTALALGVLLDAARAQRLHWRTALAAGLCAGLAGGCKYTALAIVAASAGAAILLAIRASNTQRARTGVAYACGVGLAFAPWAARSAALTGNPVYPFAYELFGGDGWSAEQARQWADAHRAPPQGRLAAMKTELLGSLDWNPDRRPLAPLGQSLFGLPLLALCVLGGAQQLWRRPQTAEAAGAQGDQQPHPADGQGRHADDATSPAHGRHGGGFLWLCAAGMIAVWAGFTQMPGRFVTPLILPMVWLASCATGAWSRGVFVAACVGAALNGLQLISLVRAEERHWRSSADMSLADLIDRTDIMTLSHPLRQLPEDARPWLVGDAAVFYAPSNVVYHVAFNRDPWLTLAEAGASPQQCLQWLRERGVTHVAFSWPEIERLRHTYGFSPVVSPEWVATLCDAGLTRIDGEWPKRFEVYRIEAVSAAISPAPVTRTPAASRRPHPDG